jgi:adenylate kinase family enzyme
MGRVRGMSRVIFVCGPSGAGKTTHAKRLEEADLERLSFDIEMRRRGITSVPLPLETRA